MASADDVENFKSIRHNASYQYFAMLHGGAGNEFRSISRDGNAKPIIFNSTTTPTNDPITAGHVGFNFKNLGVSVMKIDTNGNMGVGTQTPKAKLEVNGGVKIGSVADGDCDATTEGTQRYNSASKVMEYCNGTIWKSSFGGSTTCRIVSTAMKTQPIVSVSCLPSEYMTGGGCEYGITTGVRYNYPSGPRTWRCGRGDALNQVRTYAICCK